MGQPVHRMGRYNSLRVGLGPRIGADTCTPQPQPLMAEAAEQIDAVKVAFHRIASHRGAVRCGALSLSLLFAHHTLSLSTHSRLAVTARNEGGLGWRR